MKNGNGANSDAGGEGVGTKRRKTPEYLGDVEKEEEGENRDAGKHVEMRHLLQPPQR